MVCCRAHSRTSVILKIQQDKPHALLLIAPVCQLAYWFSGLRTLALSVTLISPNVLQRSQPHFEYLLSEPEQPSLALCPLSRSRLASFNTTSESCWKLRLTFLGTTCLSLRLPLRSRIFFDILLHCKKLLTARRSAIVQQSITWFNL